MLFGNKPEQLNNDDETIIKEIIEYFNQGQISAFIGAGFSKNANSKFPDWYQLLYRMVKELYKEDLKGLIGNERKEAKKRIINKVGTLQIPEEYIKYKGRREDLTEYIEARICSKDKRIKPENLSVHESLLRLPWVDVCTTNYDTVLEQANSHFGTSWTVVKSSDKLANFPRKRIVKLHGSLREGNHSYNFDGAIHHQYIITQNDYDTYSKVHDGFTKFMQLKVLQEAICMIGFSGNDPNFRYWIRWVRELIKNNSGKTSPNPIFLLDINNKEYIDNSPATELFFKNHNIKRIILSDLFHWLWHENNPHSQLENKKIPEQSPPNMLLELFQYLKKNIQWENPLVHVNVQPFNQREYNSFWESIQGRQDNELLQFIEKNIEVSKTVRIAPPFTMVRAFTLNNHIQLYWRQSYDIWMLLQLCVLVSNNYYIYPQYYVGGKIFTEIEDKFSKIPLEEILGDDKKLSIWFDYALLLLKSYRFEQDQEKFSEWKEKIESILDTNTDRIKNNQCYKQELFYQTGLFYANNLEEENLDDFLKNWTPENEPDMQGQWLLKKAFLLNLFHNKYDKDKSIPETIKSLIKRASEIETNPQEKLWILENYALILYSNDLKKNKQIDAEIEDLKRKGYFTLTSITDYLIKQNIKEEEIIPIDKKRNQGRTRSFGGIKPEHQPFYKAMQYLRVVEETGIILKYNNCVWDSKNAIYTLTKEMQENYLKFGICYTFVYFGSHADEDFSRKIMQDIIFSDTIPLEDKKQLLVQLLNNFDYRRKNNKTIREYLFLIAELMRIVPFEEWKEFWYYLWKGIIDNDSKDEWQTARFHFHRDEAWGWRNPLDRIITLIDDLSMVKEIINFFLFNRIIDPLALSTIKMNPHFSEALEQLSLDDNFNKKIYEVFEYETEDIKKLREIFKLQDQEVVPRILKYLEDTNSKSYYHQYYIDGLSEGKNEAIEFFKSSLLPQTTDKDKIIDIFNWLPENIQKYIIGQLKEKDLSDYNIDDLVPFIQYVTPEDNITVFCTDNLIEHIDSLPEYSSPSSFPTNDIIYYVRQRNNHSSEVITNIYEHYKNVWPKIKTFSEKNFEDSYYKEIVKNNILPYYDFLKGNEAYLKSISGYKELFKEIEPFAKTLKKMDDSNRIILNGNIDDLVVLTSYLITEQIKYRSMDYKESIQLILNRITFLDTIKNEKILFYLVWLFHSFHEEADFLEYFLSTVLLLLERYKNNLENHDRILIEDHLIRIAQYFEKVSDSQIIQYWLDKKESSLFFEVRNLNQLIFTKK